MFDGSAPANGSGTLIPQLSDSFLDRVLAMAAEAEGSVEFRQVQLERIITAREAMLEIAKEQAFYERLMEISQTRAGGRNFVGREELGTRLDAIRSTVLEALEETNGIYRALSARNLNPQTRLFAVTGPFTVTTLRSVSVRTLGFYGGLAFVLSLLVVPLICLLHYYLRREIFSTRPAV